MPTGQWIGDAPPEPDCPREGRWIAKPRKARRILQLGAWGALLGQAPNIIRQIVEGVYGKGAGYAALWTCIVLFVVLGLYFAVREALAHRVQNADRAHLDGAFGDQFPIEVTIVANGKRIGTDRGVLWFADGLIGFSGGASSFVLAAWDVKTYPKATAAKGMVTSRPSGSLDLIGAPAYAHMVVRALGKHHKAYLHRLEQFEKDTADPDAERFWPPLEPYDEARVDERELPRVRG